jgi:uncharacterized membrane protein YhaH (DUF805 family)/Tfp pilus assembly major pilin PilA
MATNNPYQTPQGQLESEDDLAYGEIKFFSPASRINRLRYWAHSMLFMLGAYALLAVGGVLAAMVSLTAGLIVLIPVYVAIIVFSFILIIQRLHDLNKTGWMSLLMLIPFANLYLLVLLIFFKGTPGRNDYGLQTPPNKTWHWILAIVVPVVFVGVLAAIAIPAYNAYVKQMSGVPEEYVPDTEYPATEEQQPALPAPQDNNQNYQNNIDQQSQPQPAEQTNYNQPSYPDSNNDNQYESEENEQPYEESYEQQPYEETAPEEQYQQDQPEADYGPVEEASTYEQATENYDDTYEEPVEEIGERSQYEHIPSEDRVVTE